jgi:excinuclease UvrABC ATPase subunit
MSYIAGPANAGSGVVVVEHATRVAAQRGGIIDVGMDAAEAGGRPSASGTLAAAVPAAKSRTAEYLRERLAAQAATDVAQPISAPAAGYTSAARREPVLRDTA